MEGGREIHLFVRSLIHTFILPKCAEHHFIPEKTVWGSKVSLALCQVFT